MTQEYYIISGKIRKGPDDIVALIRKIRNGSLSPSTQLQQDELPEIKAAQDWPDLKEFFGDKKEERPATAERGAAQQRTLGKVLHTGWDFLQRNQYSTLFSGVFVLLVIMVSAAITMAMPQSLRSIAFMLCFIVAYALLSCYTLIVLRQSRGQPVDATYLKSKITPAMKPLLLSSVFIAFPCYIGLGLLTSPLPLAALCIGLFIFTVPGLYLLTLYCFAPLLILDQGYDFWEAMEASRKTVGKNGIEFTAIIYALFVINFIAALCVLLPMAITLPITMGALAEMFDETFG